MRLSDSRLFVVSIYNLLYTIKNYANSRLCVVSVSYNLVFINFSEENDDKH